MSTKNIVPMLSSKPEVYSTHVSTHAQQALTPAPTNIKNNIPQIIAVNQHIKSNNGIYHYNSTMASEASYYFNALPEIPELIQFNVHIFGITIQQVVQG